jgi:hypothetical protein
VKRTLGKLLSWIFILVFTILLLNPVDAAAGEKDKVERRAAKDSLLRSRNLSPHKASLWALIPGAGQVYNRKYWKLPIVYAGFAVIGYFVISNRDLYLQYNDAYICSSNAENDTSYVCTDPLTDYYSTYDLQQYKDFYRRNTELSIIVGALWYILTIVDATVDAHLSHWEVNDNLSVDVQPVFQPLMTKIAMPSQQSGYNGLKVAIRF